jgi:hypothetical protein
MKRRTPFHRILIVVGILGLLGAGIYGWAQHRAHQLIAARVTASARSAVANPEALRVTNAPVQLTGAKRVRIPRLELAGDNVQLLDQTKLAKLKVVAKDVQVDLAQPAGRQLTVAGGTCEVTLSEAEVTRIMRKQSAVELHGVRVDYTTAIAVLTPMGMEVHIKCIVFTRALPCVISGQLVPSSQSPGAVDFQATSFRIDGVGDLGKTAVAAINKINPVLRPDNLPMGLQVTAITLGQGSLTATGTFTDLPAELLGRR